MADTGVRDLYAQALLAFQEGRTGEAIDLLKAVVESGERSARARADLAAMHAMRHDWVSARSVLAPALADLAPRAITLYLAASRLLGEARNALEALRASGRLEWADNVDALTEYGCACADAGENEEAVAALESVLVRVPTHRRARNVLASVCLDIGRGDVAVSHLRLLSEQNRTRPDYHLELAMCLLKIGLIDEARAAREHAEQLDLSGPALAQALYLRLFDERSTAASVLAAHERASRTPAVARSRPTLERDDRVRVGFLSSEFDVAPATFFIDPLLDSFDRDRYRVIRYNSNLKSRPPVTAHRDDLWRTLPGTDDEALAAIDADRIDVLVDLSGCFAGNRRELLIRAAAPVQAAYPNYPGSTGIPAVQWFLTDRWLTPPGTEEGYSERVYRLAGGSLRYRPPVSQTIPPCARAGEHVTFGLFQRAIKYSRATWDCISGALRATPGSRLLVHNGDPELNVDGSPLRRRILDELSARDIEASRVSFAGGLGLHAHLALIGSVDVALDTYPYSGQTTAMECLWMGVPIVSRRGSLHASRVSGALMAQVGLEKYVGDDEEGYVRAATLLTADVDELRRIRRDLRSRMIDAGLTDGARLAREVEQAFESWVDVRDR